MEFAREPDQLKVDIEPVRILIASEPYVRYTTRGYQAAVDIIELPHQKYRYLFLSARSLAAPLKQLSEENNGRFTGIEVWIRKNGLEKTSSYVVEE